MQSSWWADFRSTVGYDHFGIVLRNDNEIVGGAMVQVFVDDTENRFYYIQDGPVLPSDELSAQIVFRRILGEIDERRRRDGRVVSHLRIEPRWVHVPGFLGGFQAAGYPDRFVEPRNTLCVDLRLPESDILNRMKPKGRYNIRVAQKHGVRIVEDSSTRGLDDFVCIYEEMALHQGIEAKPRDYFEDLNSIVTSQESGSIFFAEYRGVRLATALVIFFGARATYFFGGSRVQDRNVMAPYLLHYEIMRTSKARRCEWYDLWGVAPDSDPGHPWREISVFKRKFGGSEVGLVPTLDLIYDREAYDRYVASQRARHHPAIDSNHEPPAGEDHRMHAACTSTS
jgi:lipid II:glycine glycyltransferase (peptidoglycan interpeptide bridge formation enzyme)